MQQRPFERYQPERGEILHRERTDHNPSTGRNTFFISSGGV